jgi:hypothetical protein
MIRSAIEIEISQKNNKKGKGDYVRKYQYPKTTLFSDENHSSVSVQQYQPDLDNLAWKTFQRVFEINWQCLGGEREIELGFGWLMRNMPPVGTFYVNPMFTVRGTADDARFIANARRAQLAWFAYLKSFLFTSGIIRREMKQRSPVIRQLEFTGVMIMDGKHIRPDMWFPGVKSVRARKPLKKELLGKQFGRLTVVESKTKDRWLCRCCCGKEKIVRGNHLRSGRIVSCGCRKAQVEEWQQQRKASRQR